MNRFFITNKNIDIEAKAIICYLSLYNFETGLVTTEDKICEDLQISKYRLKKYIKQLLENDFLIIEKSKDFEEGEKLYSLTDKSQPGYNYRAR